MLPIEIQYEKQTFSTDDELSAEDLRTLKHNIQHLRDVIVFFTALPAAKGLGGHTGGAYDIVPEYCIVDAFMRNTDVYPVFFDEAGHRVALQYLNAVLKGDLPEEKLLHYREYAEENPLPGHPESTLTDGVEFSSGRLGHLWNYVNGKALAHPDEQFIIFGSDGSQEEGNDAEAARFAVANDCNVNVLVDDNDVTIAGHPSEYMPGYDISDTLEGHGLAVRDADEDLRSLYEAIRASLNQSGPSAVVTDRPMAVGIDGGEGRIGLHDAIDPELAQQYLRERGHKEAAAYIEDTGKQEWDRTYRGSSEETQKNRYLFGEYVNDIIDGRDGDVLVIDCDLEGSTGLQPIREEHPEVYIKGGVMERNNYSVAAGYGHDGRQAVYGTFSAFSEMVNSEIQMARLNESDVLAHFSHAGVDWMADNTCHFGINVFFTDNGVGESRLYFPADKHQFKAVLEEVFWNDGLRFLFSTRSAVPCIEDEDGGLFYDEYEFTPGKDEIIREGEGYIVSYGAMLYRCLDAVERLRASGLDIGLINKPTLNVKDEAMLDRISDAPYVMVAEAQNVDQGLGVRFGTWLLEHGFTGSYDHMGVTKDGHGGVHEQIPHQGLDPDSIMRGVRRLV